MHRLEPRQSYACTTHAHSTAQQSHVDATELYDLQSTLDTNMPSWTMTTLVNHRGQPWYHLYIAKHLVTSDMFLTPGRYPGQQKIRLTLDDQWFLSPSVVICRTPQLQLRKAVQTTITIWMSCFTQITVDLITAIRMICSAKRHLRQYRGRCKPSTSALEPNRGSLHPILWRTISPWYTHF